MRLIIHLSLLFLCTAAAADLTPQKASRGFSCEDERTRGFNFYCDPDAVEEAAPEGADVVDPQPSPPPVLPPKTYSEQMEEYRKNLDELKHRAILEPSPQNVRSYMEAQGAMVRQAGLFTEVWQRTLFSNPSLDANVNRPLSQIGENLYQDQLDIDREAAFRDAAARRALMFVYDGAASCLVCETQGEVVLSMMQRFGVSVLPVSRDGLLLADFPKSLTDQGQLSNMGLQDVPVPFLALVEPNTNTVDLIGAGLMTTDIILDRVRIITSIPNGGLYDEQAR